MTDKKLFNKYLGKNEIQVLKKLKTPELIQEYINKSITYDPDREDRPVSQVLKDGRGECFNAALFACAALSYHGYQTSVLELLHREDEEHILCVYNLNGRYGAIAQSKFAGLKGRLPFYLNIRDLAASYLEFYFAFDGHYSLYSYSDLINIGKYRLKWLYDRDTVNKISRDLTKLKHFPLVKKNDPYFYVSPERFWKEVQIIPKGTKIPKKYLDYKLKEFKNSVAKVAG